MMPVVEGDRVLISECYQVGSASAASRQGLRPGCLAGRSFVPAREIDAMSLVDADSGGWTTFTGAADAMLPTVIFAASSFRPGQSSGCDPRRTRSSVTRVGDHLLVMEERGRLQVLKANSKEMEEVAQWDLGQGEGDRPALRYPCWSAPVVVGNQLIVRGDDRLSRWTFQFALPEVA